MCLKQKPREKHPSCKPCDTDNVFTFTKATSKILYETGAKKCTAGEKDDISDFKLSEDGKIMTLDGFDFTVVKLTATELEFKVTLFGETLEHTMKAK